MGTERSWIILHNLDEAVYSATMFVKLLFWLTVTALAVNVTINVLFPPVAAIFCGELF